MKKVLFTLAMAFMLCMSSMPVHAETYVYEDGEASIPVTFHQPSFYSVQIPESINLNGESFDMIFSSDMTADEYVNVSLESNEITLSDESGNSGRGAFLRADGEPFDTYLTLFNHHKGDESTHTFNYSFSAGEFRAGDYTGSLTFRFNLRNSSN